MINSELKTILIQSIANIKLSVDLQEKSYELKM